MEELNLEEIGDRIRGIRGTLRQSDFADRLGLERQTIGRYESGKRAPDALVLLRLMTEFGVDPAWVLTGGREPNRATSHGLNQATNPSAPTGLSAKEQVVLDAFRTGTVEQQEFILKAALGFQGTEGPGGRSKARTRKPRGGQQIFHGEVGSVTKGNTVNQAPVTINVGRGKKKNEG